ncbi:hydrogenase nickel incorporation protein HypB [candidate division KSB1 bacterium]|nr:hydrogenase nickel incorporation protein HypB [candidate division KSB1 bacterium]NIR70901.1 hydrogenase nickel incorporation protein HypB [candidate division KSB1 bacterium]NIS24671.1 hydrogenase nickel incorporation protein HypB [candidate division KSB1 bacterium]NIT71573.1 hydrogenase nickel incorporation protein HypB [candidate division KSB1 bacterium]NIU25271.1 hydrogenase nickel incorporation protein HypB [candidate division KSB1 bacterium]
MSKQVNLEKKVLSENDLLAAEIRKQMTERGIVSLNLVSSPGSGKTSLLEQTLAALSLDLRIGLIAGDVQTENDANRLVRAGGKMVRPLMTGGACHLDAKMVSRVLPDFDLAGLDLLLIENVGNLVCPSSFDLGENMKVVLISTTEGDDKPLKYPAMFRRSSVMVINKIDLLGTSDFDITRVKENARRINPDLEIFEVSCRTGAGLERWFEWLVDLMAKKQKVHGERSDVAMADADSEQR